MIETPKAATHAALAKHRFEVQGDHFLLDGRPFQIRSGEMHYARVPREYWRDRFRKMKAMGLNTVCTYSFWNLHEPEPGKFDFSGNNDVAEFIREAQREGLWVLLRPGPYSCAEWEWGGFPYWLARTPGIKVRSTDPHFLSAARGYLRALGHQLAKLQINHGGPILMVQVENEYGSFGHDMVYKTDIMNALRSGGFDGLLYTADGPTESMLSGGTLPNVLPTVNFGDNPAGAFQELEKFRPGVPRMCGEFYPGWFDSWGKPHAHTSTEALAKDIETMEREGASYSLYMVHGGTTFGFMNGANWYDESYWPQTTSYDYSTTIDEAGRPTDKFWAFRKVVQSHLAPGETLPDLPPAIPSIEVPSFNLRTTGSLFDLLDRPISSHEPMRFEQLGQAYGFVLYRTTLPRPLKGRLVLDDLQDRALVFIDGGLVATLYRGRQPDTVEVDAPAGSRLDILVENCGRINYGPKLLDEHKGIGRVHVDGSELTGWLMFRLPFDTVPSPNVEQHTTGPGVPTLFTGEFNLAETGDTFLDMRGWGKGVVWVNGHCLGRYWHIGPQQTLYVPGPWLKAGHNSVAVWELEPSRHRSLQGLKDPVFQP
jgi:beta-galactosidase